MASRWQGLADQLNLEFQGANLKATGTKFRAKHVGPGAKPYKFGQFVADDFKPEGHTKPALDAKQSAQFLIDAGSRHFEPASAKLLEDTVIESLSTQNAEIPIEFTIATKRQPGQLATVDVERVPPQGAGPTALFRVTINCVP